MRSISAFASSSGEMIRNLSASGSICDRLENDAIENDAIERFGAGIASSAISPAHNMSSKHSDSKEGGAHLDTIKVLNKMIAKTKLQNTTQLLLIDSAIGMLIDSDIGSSGMLIGCSSADGGIHSTKKFNVIQ
jgi:hypothetical protein